MRKNNIITTKKMLGFALLIALFLSTSTSAISALEYKSEYVRESIDITLDEDNNVKYSAYMENPNFPSDLFIDGENGVLTEIDTNNDGTFNVDYSTDNDTMPMRLREIGIGNEDPWDNVNWVKTSNDSMFEGDTFNISYSSQINRLGVVKPSDKKTFDLGFCTTQLNELNLDLNPGAYMLISYQDEPDTSPIIRSPMGNPIAFQSSETDYSLKGWEVEWYFFATNEDGIHSMYFNFANLGSRRLTFKLISLNVKGFGPGDNVDYKPSEIKTQKETRDSISPEDIPVQVYAVDASNWDYLKLRFTDYWGTVSSFSSSPIVDGGMGSSLVSSSNYHFVEIYPQEGRYYYFFYNPDFYTTDGQGRSYREFMYYNLNAINYEPETLALDTKVDVPVPAATEKLITFSIEETTLMKFNTTLWDATYQGPFIYFDDGNSYTVPLALECPPGSDIYYYLLQPGNYLLYLIAADNCQDGLVQIETEFLDIETSSVPIKNLNNEDETFIKDDMLNVDFEVFDVEGGGQFYPKVLPFSLDDKISYFGLNATWFREDQSTTFAENETRFELQIRMLPRSRLENSIVSNSILTYDPNFDISDSSVQNRSSVFDANSKFVDYDGWIVIQPYNLRVHNGTEWIRINESMSLKLGLADYSDYISYEEYDETLGSDQIDLLLVNDDEAPYNTTGFYSYARSINGTIKPFMVIEINGEQNIDWYQAIVRTNNTAGLVINMISPNNTWISEDGPNNPYSVNMFTDSGGTNVNGTFEFGMVYSQFYLFLEYGVFDSDFDVQIWLELRALNIDILDPEFVPVEGEANLALILGLSLGIGIPVIIGGIWFWKKKK